MTQSRSKATIPPHPPPPRRFVSLIKDPAYWRALGQFIDEFASTETVLFNYLIALVAVPHSVGRALFNGDHVDQLIGTVRRVILAAPPDQDIIVRLEPALTQFKIIGTARNSIVHYVSMVTTDTGRISSNVTRARSAQHVKEFRASPQILNDMTTDLEKISQSLLYCQLATLPGGKRLHPHANSPSQVQV